MKNGQKVAVCQDGKWGRAVLGVITETYNGHRIKVKFSVYTDDEGKSTETEHWFRVHKTATKYGGMRRIAKGWCNIPGQWCPWYSIIPIKKLTSVGLRITGVNV